MRLYEIIKNLEDPESSILIECLVPYKKSLYRYYKSTFSCEPVLMITDITNTSQYARIEASNEFNEALDNYVGLCHLDSSEEEEEYKDLINFQSMLLINL